MKCNKIKGSQVMQVMTRDTREDLSLHLHLGLCVLVSGDTEVKSDVDDGGEVEEEEGGDQQQRFIDHGAVSVGEATREG